MFFATQIKELVLTEELTETDDPVKLIVWNDEVNTFDWVIKSLVDAVSYTHLTLPTTPYV